MNAALSEAFYGVYNSSKEIVKNNQRHLFCNMLDLLISTCKSAGVEITNKVPNDELVRYWLSDILPLVFDKDKPVQISAIAAMEEGLCKMDLSTVHGTSYWVEVKNTIINTYLPQLHKLREDHNKHWYKVWCLLIRLFDKEILRSASTINTFLSVVEMGFRSSHTATRIEAFHCWRLLIQVFSAHGEIYSSKRIKLICIPLRSSQSKTAQAAVVKLRVWWYLITCLGKRLAEYMECVVEPFLSYSFGATARNQLGVAQHYKELRELALPCIMTLLNEESGSRNEFLERLLRDCELECFCQPSPLMTADTLRQHWQPLVKAAVQAIELLLQTETQPSERDQHILQFLLGRLVNAMLRLDLGALTAELCLQLRRLLPLHTRPINYALNNLAAEGLQLQQSLTDFENLSAVIKAYYQLFLVAQPIVPPAILQRCVAQVFSLAPFEGGRTQWRALKVILDELCETNKYTTGDGDIDLKLLIWQTTTESALESLQRNGLDYRLKENAVILNRLLTWPLQLVSSQKLHIRDIHLPTEFVAVWSKLLSCGQNSPERETFLLEVKETLHQLVDAPCTEKYFPKLLEAYLSAMMKLGINNDCAYQRDAFAFFSSIISQPLPKASLSSCLYTLEKIIEDLNEHEFCVLISCIKATLRSTIQGTKKLVDIPVLEAFKKAIIKKIQTFTNNSIKSQIKDILRNQEEFVVIQSVWTLKPEKLTERQRERLAEKSNIPALYNDMSQSQESSSIKPWTPKKIVLDQNGEGKTLINQFTSLPEHNANEALVATDVIGEGIVDLCTPMNVACDAPLGEVAEVQNSTVAEKESTGNDSELKQIRRSKRFSTVSEKDNKIKTSNEFVAFEALNEIFNCRRKNKPTTSTPVAERTDTDLNLNKEATLTAEVSSRKEHPTSPSLEPVPSPTDLANNENIKENDACVPENDVEELESTCEPIAEIKGLKEPTHQDLPLTEEVKATKELSDIMQIRETSPKKPHTKFPPLSSPPDRKLTNNNTSPSLRPKTASHLTGRGAQLINMIRNRKNESVSSRITWGAPSLAKYEKSECAAVTAPVVIETPAFDIDNIAPTASNVAVTALTTTPVQAKDLLVFSRRLPSPGASPSMSILKRRIRRDSLEEYSIESPAHKRKRVSFHDPPVSVTKEYLKDAEENKVKLKRCLNMDKFVGGSGTPEGKHALRRQNKLESIAQIENYSLNNEQTEVRTLPRTSLFSESNPKPQVSLDTSNERNTKATNTTTPFNIIETMDSEAILNLVTKRFSIEDILNKYFTAEGASGLKLANSLAKYLSDCMMAQPKMKTDVLETLSENHSKDFLNHAIQENLSSVVCDRLNLNSVMEYICAKSKINASCRANLLQQLPDIFKYNKLLPERLECVKALLQSSKLGDSNILELMTLLVRQRSEGENNISCVSESAVDSSSNL